MIQSIVRVCATSFSCGVVASVVRLICASFDCSRNRRQGSISKTFICSLSGANLPTAIKLLFICNKVWEFQERKILYFFYQNSTQQKENKKIFLWTRYFFSSTLEIQFGCGHSCIKKDEERLQNKPVSSKMHKLTNLQDERLSDWQDDRMTGWQDDKMTGWQDYKMTGWQDERMTGW